MALIKSKLIKNGANDENKSESSMLPMMAVILYNTSTTTKKTHFEIEQKEIASEHYQNIENCTQRNAINIHCQQKRSTDELFVSSPIKNSSNDIYKCTNTHIKEQKLKPCSSTPTKTTHFEIEQKMPANESNSNQLSFNFL